MKMPVNYEAEQAMLGSIMMDTNVANDFTTLLREDDFALQQHKQIFLAIYNLIQNNEPVDALTVADKLATSGKIAEAGGMEYIGKLATGIPSTANADKYFEIVKRDSLLRGIIEAGNKISKTPTPRKTRTRRWILPNKPFSEFPKKRKQANLNLSSKRRRKRSIKSTPCSAAITSTRA